MNLTPGFALILVVNVLLTVAAQALLRAGMARVGASLDAMPVPVPVLLLRVGLNPYVLGGMLAFSVSLLLWLALLSRIKVSVLYPTQQSLIFILLQIVAWRWLGEGFPPARLVGVAVICVGVYLVARVG